MPPSNPPPALVIDEPEWPMPQPFDRIAPRRLRVWALADGSFIAVVTERGPGMSVTNAAEAASSAARATVEGTCGTGRVRVVEHYPPCSVVAESFDEILPGPPVRWRPIPVAEMVALCGANVLDDVPALPADPDEEYSGTGGGGGPKVPEGPGLPEDAVFHGYPATHPGGRVVMIEFADGAVAPLPHYVKHSPDGFNWGYHGSAAADLARCVLISVLGGEARCRACDGGGCLGCDGGIANPTPVIYQAFKDECVAQWPSDSEWVITSGQVRDWLRHSLDR